ncbi:hypothetical protein V5799_014021 [Amblyomma americanum]|uniref:Uncharacterized protein n=1 Tax=Amblyomma americanum TaxID=6943 RepID=A0AAQ4E496_AMBAM
MDLHCLCTGSTHYMVWMFRGGRQWRGAHRTCGSAVTLCVLSFKSCSDPRGCQRAVTAATPSHRGLPRKSLGDVRTRAAPVSLTVPSFKPCSDLRGCQRAGRQDLGYGRRLVCSELQALFRSSRLPESRHCCYFVGASMPGQYPRSPARLTCPPSRPAKKEPQCQTTFGIAAPVVLVKAPIRSAAATVSSQAHYSSPHKEELGTLDVEQKHDLRASGVASSTVNFGSFPASCRCQRVVNSSTASVQRCPVDVHGAQHEQHVQHGCRPLRLWQGSGASLQLWLCLRHGLTVSLQRERCSGGQLTSMEPSASNMSGIGTAKNSVRRDFGADTKQTWTQRATPAR